MTKQARIVNGDTGKTLLSYARTAHAAAWLATHPQFKVTSQHTDSISLQMKSIYVAKASA